METEARSGSTWLTPFAYFDRNSSSWKMCQGSLLEDSGESCTTWPRQVTWDLQYVYELPTLELLTEEIDSSSLLPTPSAYESTPTDEFSEEVRESLTDPHKRLYLPGRKWHAQRTLSRMAGALLPTPGASDATGAEKETREARQENRTGGPSLRDLPKLLPTPVVTDSYGSRRATARTDEWTSNEGTSLTDAIWQAQGRETDTQGKMLPTPTGRDHKGRNQRDDDSCLPGAVGKLLPTPVANPDNPGAGGELRAALTHGEGRRNETGVDTMGRPNAGRPSRLLPTPQAADADGGRQETKAMRSGGKRPSGAKATLTLGTAVSMREELTETPFSEDPRDPPLLPTPTAGDHKSTRNRTGEDRGWKRGERHSGTTLTDAADAVSRDDPQLLPTPRVTSERNSRKAMVENDQWSSVSLAQAMELAQGILPREFKSWDEVPGSLGASTRPPSADGSQPSDEPLPSQLTIEDA